MRSQNCESTPLRRKFKNNMSSISKSIDSVNVAQTATPNVSAPLAPTSGKLAPPQEDFYVEVAATEDLRRKRENIVGMRKEQETCSVNPQNHYHHLMKNRWGFSTKLFKYKIRKLIFSGHSCENRMKKR